MLLSVCTAQPLKPLPTKLPTLMACASMDSPCGAKAPLPGLECCDNAASCVRGLCKISSDDADNPLLASPEASDEDVSPEEKRAMMGKLTGKRGSGGKRSSPKAKNRAKKGSILRKRRTFV